MGSKKKGAVEIIALQCTECKRKNYTTYKNRKNRFQPLSARQKRKRNRRYTKCTRKYAQIPQPQYSGKTRRIFTQTNATLCNSAETRNAERMT